MTHQRIPATQPGSSLSEREELWSLADVAAFLRVPEATIYRWRYTGTGPPSHKVGKHLRFFPTEVEAWVRRS